MDFSVVHHVQHVLSGKWKLVVLAYLMTGTQRYCELRKQIPEISEKMLAHELYSLVADDIAERIVYHEVPPRVEYRLTAHGEALMPSFQALLDWGLTYMQRKLTTGPDAPAGCVL